MMEARRPGQHIKTDEYFSSIDHSKEWGDVFKKNMMPKAVCGFKDQTDGPIDWSASRGRLMP